MRPPIRISHTGRKLVKILFKSFLGVPIVRGGQVFGVLVVQKRPSGSMRRGSRGAADRGHGAGRSGAQGGFFNIAELDEPELPGGPAAKFWERPSEGVASGHVVLHEPRVRSSA